MQLKLSAEIVFDRVEIPLDFDDFSSYSSNQPFLPAMSAKAALERSENERLGVTR